MVEGTSQMDANQQPQLHHQLHTPVFIFNPNNKFGREQPARPYPNLSRGSNEPKPAESERIGLWPSTPMLNFSRPRPQTIHESSLGGFSYCIPEQYTSVPAWETSHLPDTLSQQPSQTYTVPQDFYSSGIDNSWTKTCDDGITLQIEPEMCHAYTTDESLPILDLRYSTSSIDSEQLNPDLASNSRRMSGSSFTLSTTGGLSDMPSYEDFSTVLSEAPSFTSDYRPPSNRNSLMSSTHLSPVASPRMTAQNRSELIRTRSRGRASPSPRPSMRLVPYSLDSSRSKRWSTGSYAPLPNRRPSPSVYHSTQENFNSPLKVPSRHSSPTIPSSHLSLNMSNLHTQETPYMPNNAGFHRNSTFLPPYNYHEPRFMTPPPLLSHGLFRMLQSNANSHATHPHYSQLSDPPDLYASLNEEQVSPPPEDMNPDDPDLIPHEQQLRFDGDLYTPRWVRGHGNKREGWCGICKPGRWLVLKNSAFWYDKSFTHGISAATGSPFQEPHQTRRMDGNPDVWEGFCVSCSDWIALVSSKKKGTTWFRHAYKCHTHTKIKDAPKRRRESSHTRAQAASTKSKSKIEKLKSAQRISDDSFSNTPTPGHLQILRKTVSPLEALSTMI